MQALRAFWAKSLLNKLILVSLAGLLCCCPVAAINSRGNSSQPAAGGPPQPTRTTAPTRTPEPTATPRPSATPRPTADPAIGQTAQAVRAAAEAEQAAPCEPGQVKGNRESLIYHSPGQRDYEKTRENVQCFDSGAEAQAAGYRAAER